MRVVHVRLDDQDIKQIDRLVKRQSFRSRNEAIRKMIKEKLSESPNNEDPDENVEKLVKSMLRMKKAGGGEPVLLRLRERTQPRASTTSNSRPMTLEPQ